MSQLASKFIRLKTMIGGNREKYGYEDTFGMPREEQAHITRPGRANIRIISELEFAINLSEAENGRYDGVLEEALDYLLSCMQEQGVLPAIRPAKRRRISCPPWKPRRRSIS